MERYIMKQYDLEPTFEVQLLDGTTPVDLTSALRVLFLMRNRKGLKVAAPMTVAAQTSFPGVASYTWRVGDTDASGSYSGEVEVTWPNGRSQTYPGNQAIRIDIQRGNRSAAPIGSGPSVDAYYDAYYDSY